MYNYSDKNVLITGCGNSKGIGFAIAKAYAASNASLILADICPLEQIEGLKEDLMKQGAKDILCVQADVSNEEDVKRMVKESVESVGNIDILVNNAGVMRIGPFLEAKATDLDLMYKVMVRGTFLCTQEIAKHMIDKDVQGKIINMSSIGGKRPWVYSAGYCACKAAIVNFTQVAATVLAKYKINVNGIAPGDHKTEMLNQCYFEGACIEGVTPEEFEAAAVGCIPLGTVGTVEDIANACLFLTSSQASYIVGQTLNVNGGSFMQ